MTFVCSADQQTVDETLPFSWVSFLNILFQVRNHAPVFVANYALLSPYDMKNLIFQLSIIS